MQKLIACFSETQIRNHELKSIVPEYIQSSPKDTMQTIHQGLIKYVGSTREHFLLEKKSNYLGDFFAHYEQALVPSQPIILVTCVNC